MKILVLNCGSSSIKYKLFENENLLVEGLIEKIGEKKSKIKNHKQGIKLVLEELLKSNKIKNFKEINAVGHRVVHGGKLTKPVVIDKRTINIIESYSKYAPLHNPVNLQGIKEIKRILPNVKQIAVFDTSFHQTMPEEASIYAIPYEFYKKDGIRRYGFHGISHEYTMLKSAEILNKKTNNLNLITCHLGAGCSITAIKKGKVIDTSMGFTPLEGLAMMTRPGDIDPGILLYLAEDKKMNLKKIDELLNKKSGLAGISGKGNDMRNILDGYKKGDKKCKLALELFCYRIKKYIGAYTAALGKVDAIVFTAGIGENVAIIREKSTDIKFLGIKIDKQKNKKNETIVTQKDSKTEVLVIPTNEELMIAKETLNISEKVNGSKRNRGRYS